MALLPIAPGYDMLRPMNPFTRHDVELENCSSPNAEHCGATALIELSCVCKRTECCPLHRATQEEKAENL